MSSQFSDPSPDFAAPSAADDIYGVLEKALEVQKAFYQAHHLVRSLEGDLGPHAATFTAEMKKLGDQYAALFTKSRTQANELYSKISYFITGVIPAIQTTKYTDEQKRKTVSNTAKSISALAEKSHKDLDTDIAALVKALASFFTKLSQEQTQVVSRNAAILDGLKGDIARIAAKVEANGTLWSRLGAVAQNIIGSLTAGKTEEPALAPAATGKLTGAIPPGYTAMLSKVKKVGEFFNNEKEHSKAEADLDAQVKILETLKQQADREAAALQGTLAAVEKIKNDLPSLVEKMNAFATVWTKLSEDANKLNEYLNTGTPDIEQMFSVDAVLAQKDVYVALLKALDTYCLRVA